MSTSCAEAGKVPAQTHEDCGGFGGHGSAPWWRFKLVRESRHNRAGSRGVATPLQLVEEPSLALARDERALPTELARGTDPRTGTGTDPRNGFSGR